MSESHRPRPPRRYGEQPRSLAGRHFIQTQVRTDVFLRIREVMEQHNISASGVVHHLLRERFGLPPLPPFINNKLPPIHPMARDIFRTPLAEARWAHLIDTRHQLDRSKPKAWTCDLLLPNNNEKAQSFLLAMEDQFIALHGSRKRRAEKGFPWKPDKEKPSELTVVRFKVPQFQRRDGSLSEGPRIVDAKKQPWDGAAIGNGSKVVVAFDIYAWDGENGCGMTFQPRAVQVVEFVPYEQVDPTDGFEEVEGYTTTGSGAGDWSTGAADDGEELF